MEQAQPAAEQNKADEDPDAAPDRPGGGPGLRDMHEADRNQRHRPEPQDFSRAQYVQVVEREQHAENGNRYAEDELTGDPDSWTGFHRATPLSHACAAGERLLSTRC
jgi:hypothetical protein